ncbi:MAG: carboxypeptidase-like regulatory domain-containing protein [Mycobacterium sp.]
MIFGFNTDVSHEDTVYHVQSEASESEQMLQTQVFVRGRCIGKRAVPFAAIPAADAETSDQNSEQQKEKYLRELHREVLDAIREARLESVLDKQEKPAATPPVAGLNLEWINADSIHSEGSLQMKLRVTDSGAPVQGARLTLRLARSGAAPYYAQILTDAAGQAEMGLQVDESALPDASVLVQASFSGRTVTRKFQLRRLS